MNRDTVWITGAGGLIGNYFLQTARSFAPRWNIVGLTRADFDLTDFRRVAQHFRREPPQAIIHCAAMSRSDDYQAEPILARKTNIDATRNLAVLAARIPFIFFSTDLVFDGCAGNYDERASVNPLSVYAETKTATENAVLENPLRTVIRTSLNSGTSPTRDRGFDERIRKSWQANQVLNLFTDEFRSPIAAEVTTRAVWELLALHATGIYHVAGAERLSRWQIGQSLASRWPEVSARMRPSSISEWGGAPRPADTTLNCSKAQALLPFPLPHWSERLTQNPAENP